MSTLPPLGKYELLRELGRGGMGIVFEAVDRELGRKVALKMLLSTVNADPYGGPADEERFLREAKLSAKLTKHPHIVSVYEAGVIDGKRYLAMELIEGQSYSKWVKSGEATLRRQVTLLRDVARALHHAHQQGVIHRDLKPDNILLDARQEPHVTDFGLAKSVGQNVSLSLTASGMVVGTPVYMSPEQALGRKTTDHRTDVYAMGVMLYEILTGSPPFTGETAVEILLKAAKDEVPPPSTVLSQGGKSKADKTLDNICLKCLAKDPGERYASADALAEDLTRWLNGEPVRVDVPPSSRREAVPPPRSSGWVKAVAVGALLLALGLGAVLATRPPAPPPGDASRPGREGPRHEPALAAGVEPLEITSRGRAVAGLVAHWKLDEGSGTSVADSSGNRLGGKLLNGPRWVKRKGGNALHFDGGNSYVEIPHSAPLDKLRPGSSTVAAWFKPDDVPGGDGEDNNAGYRIVNWSWGGLSFLNNTEFMVQHRAPGCPLSSVASHPVANAPGGYHHLAGVVDKPSGVIINYVNGRRETHKALDNKPANEPRGTPWRIGIHDPGSRAWRWAAKGAIDSVRVYDRALTEAEIEALYKSEVDGH